MSEGQRGIIYSNFASGGKQYSACLIGKGSARATKEAKERSRFFKLNTL